MSARPLGAHTGAGNEDGAHLAEKSSISVRLLQQGVKRRVEEEEGQTGVAFITNAISPVITGLQSRLQGWRFCWVELAAVAPKKISQQFPSKPACDVL